MTCELLTVEEVAEILRLSPEAIRRRVSRGDFKAYRPSPRTLRFRLDDIQAYIERSVLNADRGADSSG